MIHVGGHGWIDVSPSEWEWLRVHGPDLEARHVDPDEDRMRAAKLVRARIEAEHPPFQLWPTPEVPMRVIAPGSVPGAPARLLSRLRSAGWTVVVTYARGTVTLARDGFSGRGADKTPKHYPAKIVGSYALRCSLGVRRAVAIWWEGGAGRLDPQGVLVWGDRYAQWIGIQEFERGL